MVHDLRNAGLKVTPQRRAIVDLFAGDDSHPTAQELFERLHDAFPSMSFATVYNTLDALTAAGLAGTLKLDGHATRFDPNQMPHHHAVCDACGSILDIAADTLEPNDVTKASVRRRADGFQVRTVEKVYRGLCRACAAEATARKS
jgi:Fe2+ or Zn2+ uptake regulation protein